MVLCLGISMYFYSNSFKQRDQLVERTANIVIPEAVNRLQVYVNDGNQKRSILLSDGTKITLMPNATVHLVDGFDQKRRNVYLKGKARFDVFKDKNRPFSVITGEYHTTALGTVFWVDHSSDKNQPSVKLLSGKVAISKKTKESPAVILATLNPGDIWKNGSQILAISNMPKEVSKESKSKISTVDAGILAFHHAPLEEVFERLSQNFDVQFDCTNTDLKGMNFYGNYNSKTPLSTIIHHIMLTYQLSIEKSDEDSSYIVSKKSINPKND